MIPLIGFAPDLDPATPGVLTDCTMTIPYESGMRSAPAAVSPGVSALAAACIGSAITNNLSDSRRFFAGTATKIYEWDGTTWNDRSRGASYSAGSDDRWVFVPYGNSVLAASPTCVIQRSTGAAFADVATAPQAKHLVSVLGFAIAFNTNTSSDQWACSALNDETSWTPSIATQATTGRLIGGAGPLTAARRFGDDVVAYKARSVFVGRYAGSPVVWDFRQLSNDVGCVGQEAIADTMIGHIFVGEDNVYLFDGTTPRPLENTAALRNWLFRDMNPSYRYKTIVAWDKASNTVTIYYCSTASITIDSAVVYHVLTKQWGRANRTIQAAVNYSAASLTYAGGLGITTYDSGPAISFDSAFWISGSSIPAVFNTSNTVQTLSGVTASSSFTTGDMGDESGYTFCDNVRMRYAQVPTTSSATGFTRDEEGGALTTQQTSSKLDGRYNMRQRGRFHRFQVDLTGDWKGQAVRADMRPAGVR